MCETKFQLKFPLYLIRSVPPFFFIFALEVSNLTQCLINTFAVICLKLHYCNLGGRGWQFCFGESNELSNLDVSSITIFLRLK